MVDELVERGIAERVVLHLADRPPAGHAQPDRGAEDARLGERRVDAAVGAEPFLEACRGPEHAAQPPDVLAHDHDRAIALHLDVERVVHGLDEEAAHGIRGSSAAPRDRPPATGGGRAVRMLEDERDVRGRLRLRLRDALPHQLQRVLLDLLRLGVRQDSQAREVALEAPDALVLPLLLDPLRVDVQRGVVGGRVRRRPVRHRLDEGRPLAGPRARDRVPRRLVHGEDVASVDAHARNPVADRLVGERRRRRLGAERSRDRPLVVVAEEDHRRLHHPRERRALVERALRRRAVAEERERDTVLALEARPPREPDGMRDLRRDGHADRGDVELRRIPPARRVAPPPGEHGRDGHPAQEPDRRLAVARKDPVAVLEREHGAGLHRLVVPEDRVRADPALPVVDDRALVVRPQEHEVAVELEQLVRAEPVDLAVRDRLAVADDAAQVLPRRGARWLIAVAVYCRTPPKAAVGSIESDEHRHGVALGFVDRLEDVAGVLAVHLERQRAVADDHEPVHVVHARCAPRPDAGPRAPCSTSRGRSRARSVTGANYASPLVEARARHQVEGHRARVACTGSSWRRARMLRDHVRRSRPARRSAPGARASAPSATFMNVTSPGRRPSGLPSELVDPRTTSASKPEPRVEPEPSAVHPPEPDPSRPARRQALRAAARVRAASRARVAGRSSRRPA